MELQVEAALRGEEMRWIISSVQWRRSLIITENDDVYVISTWNSMMYTL